MFSRHPLGAHDLLLPLGIAAAVLGHFYTAMLLALIWGWLNKRRAIRFRQAQHPTEGVSLPPNPPAGELGSRAETPG